MRRHMPDHEGLQSLSHDPASDLYPVSYDTYAEAVKLSPDSTPKYYVGHHSHELRALPTVAVTNSPPSPRRRCWRILTIAALLLTAVLIVAITVPLVLRARTPSPPAPSESLIFSGAAIATAGGGDPTYIYFQHSDQSIWQYSVSGIGNNGPITASDGVRSATPIAAVSYGSGYNQTRHVVYIDRDNILRDIYEVNSTGTWWNGTIGAAGFEASTSSHAGLSAAQFRQLGTTATTRSLRVFFGGTDGRIHMATLTLGETAWNETYVFPADISGDSGFAAIQPDVPEAQQCYLFCADTTQTLRWFVQSTTASPTTEWSGGGGGSGISVNPGAQVAVVSNELVIYQDQSNTVHALNITATNESVTFDHASVVDSAIPQTPLAARLNPMPTIPVPTIWMPTMNGHIAEYTLDTSSWTWVNSSLFS